MSKLAAVRNNLGALGLAVVVVVGAAVVLWKPGGEGGAVLAGVFIGSLLGFLFSEHSQLRRELSRNQGVRAAIRLEFEQNMASLRAYWDDSLVAPDHFTDAMTTRQSRFVLGMFPPWSRTMWLSQAPFLTSALSAEELDSAMRLEREYDHLLSHVERIRPSLEGDPEVRRINSGLWQSIEASISNMLSSGNPISGRDD